MTQKHLQSIILYCDFTKLCTLFSQSLRKNNSNEGLEDIKKRNSKFFHLTKLLRELVTYFGSKKVAGPFFSGVSTVLKLSEFSIAFNTPTSTSKTKEIALRFAGEGGMIITVGNKKGDSIHQPVFNATWISAFCEEDEYLWFGSVRRLSVEAISIVASCRTYTRSIGALYLFAVAISGQSTWGMTATKKEVEILDFCFKHVSGLYGDIPSVAPQGVDEYIMDCVHCFIQRTTKLHLWLSQIYMLGSFIRNFIFYGMSNEAGIPTNKSNLFRTSIFNPYWTTNVPIFNALNMDRKTGVH